MFYPRGGNPEKTILFVLGKGVLSYRVCIFSPFALFIRIFLVQKLEKWCETETDLMFSDEPVGKFILQNPKRITQKELQQEFLVSCCRYVLLNFEDKDEK